MKIRPAEQGVLDWTSADYDEPVDRVEFDFAVDFGMSRRRFVQALGAGLLITVALDGDVSAQEAPRRGDGRGGGGRGGRGGGPPPKVAARLHIAKDGAITVFTGKVEGGQGARAQLSQAAAEELRVPVEGVKLVMADTALVPNDGITAGSRSTPGTMPAIRQGAAAARDLLVAVACKQWQVQPAEVEVADGKVMHAPSARGLSYGELAASEEAVKAFEQAAPPDVTVTPVPQWKVLGVSTPRPNERDLVTGKHEFPSDVKRPGMLYGKVLRPPSYGAQLTDVNVDAAKEFKGVSVVRDGSFVGVAAPSSFLAADALDAIASTARWETKPHPPSNALYQHLRQHARGGMPVNPFSSELGGATKKLKQQYNVAYVQHAPMEPRAAVAEWDNGNLTVWTATQNPFGVRGELARAFQIPEDKVRVVVPDFGGGFGGKHSGECAVEAARLAKAAKKPVSLRWTREEEFTWAYFRPAAAIDAEASLDKQGSIASWFFVNVNSGGSAVETPYRAAKSKSQFVQCDQPPLRHGSYRALASTANTFARECFMDELADLAGKDPLAFRLAHLGEPRLRAVLEQAAKRFDWPARAAEKKPNVGVGLACGTEKASYVAACAEVEIDPSAGTYRILRVCQAYECGKIVNPKNLMAQVEGCILQGLGPLLREEMHFEGGKITNPTFSQYLVPRFEDVPKLDIHLIDRPDLPPVGAGETPIIAVAPAVANALWRATGQRMREMPIRFAKRA